MAHITSSVYSDVIQAGSMGGGEYCGSILLKCLCACITHSAVRLSYENIMAIKWDCGIIPLHCLSPRGCAVVWELPSWTQTRQKWSLISDNILAERINPYYHIKYLLVCVVCFYTCKHSYWQINKVCKKQRQKKKTILKRFGHKQDITTYQNRWEFERCGLRMVVPSAAGVRAHVACNSCEPDRSNYSP